jgi:hypothetical protein
MSKTLDPLDPGFDPWALSSDEVPEVQRRMWPHHTHYSTVIQLYYLLDTFKTPEDRIKLAQWLLADELNRGQMQLTVL